MAIVHVPAPMRTHTGGASEVSVPGETLGEVIDRLEESYPGIKARLVADERIRPGLAAFVDGENVTAGLKSRIGPDSEIYFTPAISGG